MQETKMFALGEVKAVEDANGDPNGEFDVILSTPTLDRDGEIVDSKIFDPLPDHITFDIDHGMSTATTVGSGTPFYDGDVLRVKGTYSSIPRAQEVRTLVREGHIRTTSVAFMGAIREEKDGVPHIVKAELLNGAFVPIPSNRESVVLSAKSYAAAVDAAPRVVRKMIDLSEADTEFLTAMMAHHDAAVKMATDYLAGSPGPDEIVAMVEGIIAAQTEEIATMREWLGMEPKTATPAPRDLPSDEDGKSPASNVVEMARIRADIARQSLD